VYTVSVII